MPTDRRPTPSRSWSDWLIFGLLFLGCGLVPLLIGGSLVGRVLEMRAQSRLAREERRLRDTLYGVAAAATPQAYLHRRFRWLNRALSARRPDRRTWEAAHGRLSEHWRVPFLAFRMNVQGVPEVLSGVPDALAALVPRFWAGLRWRRSVPDAALDEALRREFGPGFTLAEARRLRGRLIPVTREGGEGALFWDIDPYSRLGGLLVVVPRLPDMPDLLNTVINTSALSRHSLLLSDSGGRVIQKGVPLPAALRKNLLSAFAMSEGDTLSLGTRFWIRKRVGPWVIHVGQDIEP